jgi:TetR/AcrR family transcriptional repressor of nem operon
VAKRFDPDAALEAALEAFWTRGYAATSAQDLVDAMGINRGSWYATFGGKADLYRRALQRYCRRDADAWRERLSGDVPFPDAVRRVLEHDVEQLVADPQRRGCMLANAAAELRPGQEGAEEVAAALDELHAVFAAAAAAAVERGELAPTADPDAVAAYLVVAIHGFRSAGKARPDARRLRAAVDGIVAGLRATAAPAGVAVGDDARAGG